jgi:hypothetical protein
LVNGNPDQKQLSEWWNEYKMTVNGGVSTIPYLAVIRRKLKDSELKTIAFEEALEQLTPSSNATGSDCFGIIQDKLTHPCFLELIWSYWHEESMMVQGLNAIGRRFQNIKGPGPVDPLANLEIDPLRPLNNLLWGYMQRRTAPPHRRAPRLRVRPPLRHHAARGKAVPNARFADSRSKFIEAFHDLLNMASRFYRKPTT